MRKQFWYAKWHNDKLFRHFLMKTLEWQQQKTEDCDINLMERKSYVAVIFLLPDFFILNCLIFWTNCKIRGAFQWEIIKRSDNF